MKSHIRRSRKTSIRHRLNSFQFASENLILTPDSVSFTKGLPRTKRGQNLPLTLLRFLLWVKSTLDPLPSSRYILAMVKIPRFSISLAD